VSATLLVTPAELDSAELEISGEAYHHLFHAARAAVGDAVRMVDGRGRARCGEIVRVERRCAAVRLGAAAPSLEPVLWLELLVAAPRPSRASWLVEKGTELGVRAFRFLDWFPGVYMIGGFAIASTRRRQRLGDQAAGTSVYRRADLPLGA